MFSIFGIPVSADDHIFLQQIRKCIHPNDLPLIERKWEEMKVGNATDFRIRIIRHDEETRYVHFITESITGKNNEITVQGICHDITKDKIILDVVIDTKDELELRLKKFHRAEEVARSGTWQIDLNTHEAFYSDNVFRLYGVAPRSLPAHLNTFNRFIHPDERAVVAEMSDTAFQNKIPLHLEHRIVRADGEERHIRVISEVTRGLTGEEIMTGIIRDITEQKQLELELREINNQLAIQNKHFHHAEQIGRMGIWQISLATREAWYSDNLYRIYGLKPQSVSTGINNFLPFVFSEDKILVSEAAEKAFAGEAVPDIEFRIAGQDGKMRYLRQSMKIINAPEHGAMMIGLVQDITGQKILDKKLQEVNKELTIQNEAFVQAEQTANIGIWRWNLTSNEIFYSDNIYRIYGLKPQSVKPGLEIFSRFFHPDDLERLRSIPGQMQTKKEPVNMEYRIYRADGELRYLRARNRMITTPAGEEIFIGTTQDITEEVVLSSKLKESIRFVRMLNNNLIDQVMVTNTTNVIVEFNRAAETIQAVNREDVIGRNFFEVFPQSKQARIIENFNKALNGEIVHEKSITSPLNKGIIDRYHIPVKDEQGLVIGVLTVVRDVTQEHILKTELQHRLSFIENLLDASVSRVIALDKDLNYTVWNRKAEEYYRLPKATVVGKNILQFNPGFKKEEIYHQLKEALNGKTMYIAPNENPKDGYHEAYIVPLTTLSGGVTGVLWIINDLTERREAEKAVEESRNLLSQTAAASPDCITIYDLVNKEPVYLNDCLADWIGISVDTLTHMGAEGRIQLVHPDDRKSLLEFNEHMRSASDGAVRTIEYRIINKQRNYIWIRNRSKVFRRADDATVTHILSILQDFTEQKRSEQQLHELKDALAKKATDKYHKIIDSIDEGYCIIEMMFDATGKPCDWRFIEVNPAFEKNNGLYNAVGKTIRELTPDIEPKWFDIYGQVAQTRKPIRFEEHSAALNRWFDLYAFPVDPSEPDLVGVLFTNITERKRNEERQAYLLGLSDALRSLKDPLLIESAVTNAAMNYFRADRCYYCDIDGDDAIIHSDASRGGLPTVAGRYPLSLFVLFKAVVDIGEPFVVHDVHSSNIIDEELRQLCIKLRVISFINVPVVKEGKASGILSIVQKEPRHWTDIEIELAADTAERTWAAVERAKAEEALRRMVAGTGSGFEN